MLTGVAAALALVPTVMSGGYPVLASGPNGLTLRYIPNQPFAAAIVLRNSTRAAVEIDDVTAVEPLGTLVRQIGTRLQPWNPPKCPRNASCPGYAVPLEPYTPSRAKPLRVLPGHMAAVELIFRLSGCSAVPLARPGAPTRVGIVYRSGGKALTELLPLGGAALRLRFPKPSDCAPRPHSTISITGRWAASSSWTIPGSAGDTCTKNTFTSRWYQAPGKPEVRVVIHFPREVDVVVGIGIHGWTTFRSRYAVVSAHRFHATIVGRGGTTFRAYGAWRCRLR